MQDDPRTSKRWQFWIDRGGTFTDVVGKRPDGALVTHKLLSDNPEQYRDAAVAGIRHLLGLGQGEPVTPEQVACVKMGTTVATNALLERKGEPTLLVITRGFRDALRIAYQDRPRIFDRHIVLPELLYSRVIEADERVAADGTVVRPLDEPKLAHQLGAAFETGLRSVAIVFMHGWCHQLHEQAAGRLARQAGFPQVSVSHEVSPLMKLVGRGDTTVVDAYLSPILRRYVERVAAEMPGVRLFFMQSSGGLADAHAFQGKDAILSGPAGGIVGMVRTAQLGLGALEGGAGASTGSARTELEATRSLHIEPAHSVHTAPTRSVHTEATRSVHAAATGSVHAAATHSVHVERTPSVHAEPIHAVHVEPAPSVHVEPTHPVHAEPAPSVHVEPTHSVHAEPTPSVHVEPTLSVHVEPTHAVHLEPTRSVDAEPTHPVRAEPVEAPAPPGTPVPVRAELVEAPSLPTQPVDPASHIKLIGFDMGGTSTDVSHFAGEFERAFETQVAGVRMRAPMMSIHTVAAGGGSILAFDGSRLRAGPHSAGANPGPACYRRGGPLTVTDANVMVGKIQPDCFPRVFGPHADQPLDREIVADRFARMADDIARATGPARTPEEVAEGFIDIAVGAMANAIKKISVARGYDVTRYTLQCFGGAGGQHACRVADALGMNRVFIHPLAGVLSAYGMGLADQSVMREAAIELPLEASVEAVAQRLDALAHDAQQELQRQGVSGGQVRLHRRVHVRYEGTDSSLVVPFASPAGIRESFEAAYLQRFAFLMPERRLVVEAVSVEAVGEGDAPAEPRHALAHEGPAPATRQVPMFSGGQWHAASLVVREQAQPGHFITGPAIIAEKNATTVVEPGWQARVTALDHLVLERVQPRVVRRAIGTHVDPVMLEVFNNLFMNIAEQMGLQLQNTAYSVNIKERLDFSCALFDGEGNLIANAPHMPVHLGSMSESIKTVIARNVGRIEPGDVFVLNDPYHGGTHLPDVTVVTPVFDDPLSPSRILFYVGSRGHHADIGGITPGSMPPFSTRIEEEGVQIDNVKLLERGRLREHEMLALLRSGTHPSRNPEQNLADLKAQIAANEKGAQELRKMVAQFGLEGVQAYMRHVQDNAEESVRRVITRLKNGEFTLPLDNGAHIHVTIKVDAEDRSAVIDFSGSSAQLANNFNAPKAVCMAAVLYVFRTLVDDDIPLNAGCLKPLHVIVPEGSMLNPCPPASVVAGNVETSTCITNALYGALGVMASGQCTMNNFTFGNERYQYYETISGGSGAGPGFDGTSVVQTHMTNSRLTDPEVLEFRFPVRLESYEIRQGSGGAGRQRGGDGGIRRVRFLERMTASILSNGRKTGAFGMAGGQAGLPGVNRVERADGTVQTLDHIGSTEMHPGDVFIVETPGGGGYGKDEP